MQYSIVQKGGWYYGTGRRKRSVARVYLKRAQTEKYLVNGTKAEFYFDRKLLIDIIKQPLLAVGWSFAVVKVNIYGGGKRGQAEAIRLGLSRALVSYDYSLKAPLASLGLMTRDPREVERKKVGLRKARKSKQFSKR